MEVLRAALAGDDRGLARALGGILLATGVLVLLFRKTSFEDPWDTGVIFLFLAVTFAFLYGSGMIGALATSKPTGWQTALVVFGLVLLPITLFAFLDWVDGNADAPLNSVWIFGLTAAASFAAGVLARVRFGFLIGSLALLVAWLALWQEFLDDGVVADVGTLRGLLVVAALLLLVLAGAIAMRASAPERAGSDVVTAAGIAAVAAGGLAAINLFLPPFLFAFSGGIDTNLFWDLELLVVSLALIVYGSTAVTRGPAYIGAVGLLAFIYIVGLDLDDDSPSGGIVWPLILLVIGAALFAFSLPAALRRRGG